MNRSMSVEKSVWFQVINSLHIRILLTVNKTKVFVLYNSINSPSSANKPTIGEISLFSAVYSINVSFIY
jgi:hypothetical protein